MRDHHMCCCPDGRCGAPRSPVSRCWFLGLSTAAATADLLAAHTRDAYAAGRPPLLSAVPADKGLSPETIAGLRARDVPIRYTGDDLRYIGMPIGGGCCGQVYLGGDGRLWYRGVDNGPPVPGADGWWRYGTARSQCGHSVWRHRPAAGHRPAGEARRHRPAGSVRVASVATDGDAVEVMFAQPIVIRAGHHLRNHSTDAIVTAVPSS